VHPPTKKSTIWCAPYCGFYLIVIHLSVVTKTPAQWLFSLFGGRQCTSSGVYEKRNGTHSIWCAPVVDHQNTCTGVWVSL